MKEVLVMEYPEEVIAVTKKGVEEVRQFVDGGEFLIYEYLDPQTGKPTSNKKKIVLKGERERREFFLIRMKDGRFLLIPLESKGRVKVWRDGKVFEF